MNFSLHIGMVSVLFDERPEGICTGRLTRALLQAGHRVTLYTSNKARLGFEHPNLRIFSFNTKPRDPKQLFEFIATLQGQMPSNFYLWTRRLHNSAKINNDVPDLFYGRCSPYASLVGAYTLARRFNKPLMLHFSDPLPSPTDPAPNMSMQKDLPKLLQQAQAVTFTNKQTIAFQQQFTPFPAEKAFVLNHVGQGNIFYPENQALQQYYYIGSVGLERPAEPLLDGFAKHLSSNEHAQLYFVGSDSGYLQPLITERKLTANVSILPFTNDVGEIMAAATALVSIDALIETPLFTPTKIIEYLNVNRKVLAITPSDSPVHDLLKQNPESTVAVNAYSPAAIAKGFSQLDQLTPDKTAYQKRFANMLPFTAQAVAKTFADIFHTTQKKAG